MKPETWDDLLEICADALTMSRAAAWSIGDAILAFAGDGIKQRGRLTALCRQLAPALGMSQATLGRIVRAAAAFPPEKRLLDYAPSSHYEALAYANGDVEAALGLLISGDLAILRGAVRDARTLERTGMVARGKRAALAWSDDTRRVIVLVEGASCTPVAQLAEGESDSVRAGRLLLERRLHLAPASVLSPCLIRGQDGEARGD